MSDQPTPGLPRVTGEVYTRHDFVTESCPTGEPHRIEDCTIAETFNDLGIGMPSRVDYSPAILRGAVSRSEGEW